MDAAIDRHYKFVVKEIKRLSSEKDKKGLRDLLDYHDMMTRNFQHERQIHLFITLFFAGLMLLGWALFVAVLATLSDFSAIIWLVGALVFLLTTLESFYIRYYYHLENRTEKLYQLTDEIYLAML